jgi:Flp pilus assembly protein TadD
LLAGSIASLGSHYVLGLNVLNCQTGDSLASDQVETESREKVLGALGQAATKMRAKLGESLATIQKYDAPVEQATTSSLEALRAYDLGLKSWDAEGDEAAIPFFQRATELDPNFAMVYARLGTAYFNHGHETREREATKRAYELRDRVTEPEKLYIESHYLTFVTGQLEKAAQVYELWQKTYPRDGTLYANLASIYGSLGQHQKALGGRLSALRLEPNDVINYTGLAGVYISLERPDQAREVLAQAQVHKLNSTLVILQSYELAFCAVT